MELTKLSPPERSRIYRLRNGATYRFDGVTHFLARPSGSHRLQLANGKKFIVSKEIVADSVIELDVDEWSL